MKYLGAFVVLTLATLFYNVEGLILDKGENDFETIRPRSGWNKLIDKNRLKSVGDRSLGQIRVLAKSGEGTAGGADPTDDDTDLLEQWCENSYEPEGDLIRWLLCTVRDIITFDGDSDSAESASSTESNESNSTTESNSGSSGDTTNNDTSTADITARSNETQVDGSTTTNSPDDNSGTETILA